MRILQKKKVTLTDNFKAQLLCWAQQFDEVIWMDSNAHQVAHSKYNAILAVEAFTSIKTDFKEGFKKLDEYQRITNDWLFGYLTYDLKNDVEHLSSSNHDGLQFPDLYFFQPKKVFLFTDGGVELHYLNMVDDEVESDWQDILNTTPAGIPAIKDEVKIRLRTSKDSYFSKFNTIIDHIHRGDIYEANFCQEFFAEQTNIDPVHVYLQLNSISMAPFSTFFKMEGQYALSASPERYLQKQGTTIITQPIKGTAKRAPTKEEDDALIAQLQNDPKERSENIMITDLVRNDLSRIANKGTVKVLELCKIYTFEQVHQMISTITCEIDASTSPVSILRSTFPMGSMTGAPKVSAMKIIEKVEDAKRGLYSGTMGYFTPDGDFDFNVVIRSILYNAQESYVSYSVGGAITAQSIAENEYEECLLKAKAMREVLELL